MTVLAVSLNTVILNFNTVILNLPTLSELVLSVVEVAEGFQDLLI